MTTRLRTAVTAALLGLLVPAVTTAAPSADFAFRQRPGIAVPGALALIGEDGREVRLQTLFGRAPIVLLLGYLDCRNLCSPALTATAQALGQSGARPGADYTGVFVSIDPRDHASAAAAAHRERIPRDQAVAWHVMTGEPPSVRALADAVGFRYAADAANGGYRHSVGAVVLTPAGRVAAYLPGLEHETGELSRALRFAAAERVAPEPSLPQGLRLLCATALDAAGRHGRLIHAALGIACLAFAAGLAALLVAATRRRAS